MIIVRSKLLIKLVLLFFIIFFIISVSHHMRIIASLILYPCIKIQHAVEVPFKRFISKRETNKVLKQHINSLQEQNANLNAKNIELMATQIFYENMCELHQFKQKYNSKDARLVQVIMKQFTEYEHSFLIDSGSMHGIQEDMVAVYKNNLVVRITEVYPYYSKVILSTDASCKVAAYCRTSKARGIHEGLNKEQLTTLKFVSHLHTLLPHDVILSSGEGLIFPQGFAIGIIEEFKQEGLYHSVTVKPLLDFNTLEYCYIIKKGE